MTEEYFRVEGLDVGYGTPIIKDICFSIGPGQILTLIGPNGAGKTTIIKSIIRHIKPMGGIVYIQKEDMSSLAATELAKKVSVMLTSRTNTEFITCREVVSMGRYPYTGKLGILSDSDNQKVDEAMELVGISMLRDRDFTRISDGQRQRVLLARALCQEPELLVLDEPTSFLDIRFKLDFLSLVQKLSRQKNMAVIMSLHEIDLAQRVADLVVCVKGDHIARFGTSSEVFVPGFIEELYGITDGFYDSTSGSVELSRRCGDSKVFVIAGAGFGTPVFRTLQRKAVPFSAGILWENDIDHPASALAVKRFTIPAFSPISDDIISDALREIDRCEKVICALPESMMTGTAEPLKELLRASNGKLTEVKDL